MGKLAIFAICLIAGTSLPLPVRAHHSFATHYDPTRSIELHGRVIDFSYRSPHSFLYLEAASERGDAVTWEIEMASVPLLRRFGINAAIVDSPSNSFTVKCKFTKTNNNRPIR